MTRRDGSEGASTDGNPSEEQVESDFSVPDDADLRPIDDGRVGEADDA